MATLSGTLLASASVALNGDPEVPGRPTRTSARFPTRWSPRSSEGTIAAKTVTYDFHRLMEGATLVMCPEFGRAIIAHM